MRVDRRDSIYPGIQSSTHGDTKDWYHCTPQSMHSMVIPESAWTIIEMFKSTDVQIRINCCEKQTHDVQIQIQILVRLPYSFSVLPWKTCLFGVIVMLV